MKVFGRLLPSLLLAISLFGATRAGAQTLLCDSLSFRPEIGLERSWTYAIFNRNSSFKQINKVTLQITTPGMGYDPNGPGGVILPPATYHSWDCLATSGLTLMTDSTEPPKNGGQPIAHGQADSTFDISFDTPALQQYTCIQWTTYFVNNGTSNQICSGTTCLFTRYDQYFQPHDLASVTSSILPNCDASFNFKITARNGLYLPIDGLKVSLVNEGSGSPAMLRPSAIMAPDGWVLDSVNATDAFFHANGGGINIGSSQDGFIVTVRGDPSQHSYSFEWTAYTRTDPNTLIHIDYDTTAFIAATPCAATTDGSNDTVVASPIGGCAYNMTMENSHVSTARPTSPLTKLVMVSQTPGVTFESSPNSAPNWAVLPSADHNSITFLKMFPSSPPLPSGRSNSFSVVMSNPAQGPFTLKWTTYDTAAGSAGLVSSDVMALDCKVQQPANDTVRLVNLTPENCTFRATVNNTHYPNPSNIHAVGFAFVNPSEGTFGSKTESSLGWTSSLGGNNTVIRFTGPPDMPEYQSQIDTLSINPTQSNTPILIQWTTYDASNKQINSGVDTANCTVPPPPCDAVSFTHMLNDCRDTIAVQNARPLTEGNVVIIRVKPQGGWKVDSAEQPSDWTSTIYANKDSIDFTGGSIGFGLRRGGFVVHYRPSGADTSPITVDVETYNDKGTPRACQAVDDIPCTYIPPIGGVGSNPPAETVALSAHPNPFSGRTEVTFTLPEHEHVGLVLIDELGRVQRTVADGMMETGDHSISFDGSALPAGTYYLRLETPFSRVTKKLAIER